MAMDTPARIAVLGAGPIGLEAALYARFLGYDVDVYERGQVGQNMLSWQHVRMFSPFGMNCSSLGLAALAAQDSAWQPPDRSELLTAGQYLRQYLLPLSTSDLLSDSVHCHIHVRAIAKQGLIKGEAIDGCQREERPFCLLLETAKGDERFATADIIIDASGTWATPRGMGPDGLAAMGEVACADRIERGIPDLARSDHLRYAGKRVLVVGAGYSAATNVAELADAANASVVWVTRRDVPEGTGPLPTIPDDSLPERDQLARRANQLALDNQSPVTWMAGRQVASVQRSPNGRLQVELTGEQPTSFEVDEILANVGCRPDTSVFSELHVQLCYATDGPIKLAAALLAASGTDCLQQPRSQAAELVTTEPHFYILGSKSYGRNSNFLLRNGIEQVRLLFSTIAGRESLNLYDNMQHLLS